MNGVFILDALRALPWNDPMGWADSYYNQYPAITFGFYPPLPALLLAPFYAIFGVSTSTTVIFMGCFAFVLFTGVYALARNVAPPIAALTAMTLLAGTTETLIWGRQMMLEIPMMAFSIWSMHYFIRYLHTDRWQDFLWSAGLMVAALYTKQTAAFFIPAMAGIFIWQKQFSGMKRPHIWVIMGVAVLALIPLVILQLKFASFNVTNVASRADINVDRLSVSGLLWYPARLIDMTSLPFMLFAIFGAASLGFYWRRVSNRILWMLLIAGFIIGLAALTGIALKETRHATLLLPALAIIAIAPFALTQLSMFWQAMAFTASLAILAFGLANVHVDTIEGTEIAAERIAGHMPEGGRVAISAHFDGPFIFRLRQLDADRRYHIVRIDKLLLDIMLAPELGLNAKSMTESEISKLLLEHNFKYIVMEPNDFMSAEVMQRFKRVMEQPPFVLTDTIPITADGPKRVYLIYKNTAASNKAQPVIGNQRPSVTGP